MCQTPRDGQTVQAVWRSRGGAARLGSARGRLLAMERANSSIAVWRRRVVGKTVRLTLARFAMNTPLVVEYFAQFTK